MNPKILRAWWWHRQGLDGALKEKSPADVLARSGWARSVGGVGPYLTVWARANITREATDAAVAALAIHELPSARGCTYVLPHSDFALGLTVSQGFGDDATFKAALKLGVTEREIDKLCARVVDVLDDGPLGVEEIREAVGKAARSLGPDGKKKGLTTTLPVALGRLQTQGQIRRVPINGRLDQQRYRYSAWKPNPLAAFKLTQEEAYTELARKFFRWAGPATLTEFQWFSGLGVKVSTTAVAPLGLVPMEKDSPRLMFPDDRDALLKFKPPTEPQYALLAGADAFFLLRRNLDGLFDDADAKRQFAVEKTVMAGSSLTDLPNHAILDRGRLIGLWEYDYEAQTIVAALFIKPTPTLKATIAATETFVREQLGDARSFSLDSPQSRTPKIAALKQMKA